MRIITISREFGSGGRELGKRLADALGFAYYDREIVSSIAEKCDLDEGYVENVLRKGLTINVPVTFGHTFYFYSDPASENELKVLNTQQQIIRELAQRGDCVMVGRCSGVILEKENPLRLFVYADMEWKVKRCRERASESERLTDREFEKKIRQIDAGRARHQKLLSDRKWGDREGYDLCVNTTGVEIKKLIPGLKEYALCWFGQRDGK
ncbi:MAG TPA: cytidylate kinase-like family protein [Candidatus Eisenbergiella stercorigallinarum]|uniref:Cytidylate kinase-like family protein n=1 Tax=Candidatus Eisenbergiella stercorigallinarum TaxID=2838557 RepID=A0A9D2R238_9FIRM|nr:cytidylate kinase-like family protein [Candidatus Eisenbergiella stercorigallinarum]